MAEQERILPGVLKVRQSGGTPGTDEVQIYHDGTESFITSEQGNITLSNPTLSITLTGSALEPGTPNVLTLGSLTNYLSNVFTSSLESSTSLSLFAAEGDPGENITLTAGNATAASGGDGGDIVFVPGSGDGAGADGIVSTPAEMQVGSLTTDLIERGSAGNVSLFADVGANNITMGEATSTVVIAGNLQVDGTTTTINSTNLDVTDKNITVNDGGTTAGATVAGINIEGDAGAVVGYLRSAADNANIELKAPTGSIITLDINSNSTLLMSANLSVNGVSAINQNVQTTASPSFTQLSVTGAGSNAITGSMVIGSATGGSQGAGTINAEGLYVNGVSVAAGVSDLDDLGDVVITAVSAGDLLYYDGADWVNEAPGSVSGVQAWDADLDTIAALAHTSGNVIRSNGTIWQSIALGLNDLAEVVFDGTDVDGQVLRNNGTNFVRATLVLSDLGDATITTPADGHILYYDSGEFVNAAPGATSGVQPYDADLATIAGLSNADGNFIVGNGSAWIVESGNTARTSLGVGDADDVTHDSLTATTQVTTPTIERGAAGNASLYEDIGANNLTIGGGTSTVVIAGDLQVDGTTTTVNSTVLDVTDKNITVNVGGTTAGATVAGIDIEGDAAAVVGYLRSAADNANLEFKAPTGSILTVDMDANHTINLTAGTTGEVIRFNGTSFTNTALTAGDIGGFDILGPASGDVLYYDGSNFANAQPGSTSGVQAWDDDLDDIAALAHADGNIIVSDGSDWTVESGDTARISLGVGSTDNPTFAGTIIGSPVDDAVSRERVLFNTTTDATQTELFVDGAAQRLTIDDDTTWLYDVKVIARRTDANDESAAYRFEGAIDRNTGVATTALVGDNETSITEDITAWNVTVDADTTNGSLRIRVTGQAAKNIKWVAFVRTVEVTG